jgi:hypothetical protein
VYEGEQQSKVFYHLSGNSNRPQYVLYFQNVITAFWYNICNSWKGLDFYTIKKYDNIISSWIFEVEQEIKLHPSSIYTESNHRYPSGTLISRWNSKKKECELYERGWWYKQGHFETPSDSSNMTFVGQQRKNSYLERIISIFQIVFKFQGMLVHSRANIVQFSQQYTVFNWTYVTFGP